MAETPAAPDRVVLLQTLRRQVGRHLYPVHRLDRQTSGVIAFALSSEAAAGLQAQLGRPETRKEYLVLARGAAPDAWCMCRPLSNDRGVKQVARTEFTTLARFARCSLLRARLFTGRRRQIRRHLDHAHHQAIGCTHHGKGKINRALRADYGLPRLALHAERLVTTHPVTGAALDIHAPLASDLRDFLLRLPDAPTALIEELARSHSALPCSEEDS